MDSKMTPEQFVYWLQGFFEVTDPKQVTSEQTKIIKEHLDAVFNKFPRVAPPTPPIQEPYIIPSVWPYMPVGDSPITIGPPSLPQFPPSDEFPYRIDCKSIDPNFGVPSRPEVFFNEFQGSC